MNLTTAATSTFSYRARDASGQIVTGSMVGENAEEIGARLRAEGKYVLEIQDRPLRSVSELDAAQIRLNETAKRVRRDDVIAFCEQLSVMLETGVPLGEALESFSRQATRRELRIVMESLKHDIFNGEPLSTAMIRWPRVFPPLVISLTKASEASGTMAMMLGRMGVYLAKERRTARQVKGALGYPIFMIISGLAMTTFLMAFVLPRFAEIYEQRSASLPTPTKVLLAISDFIVGAWPIYAPVVVTLGIALALFLRLEVGRRCADWIRLSLPVIGGMYTQLYITRAMRTMSTLLSAGVNLLDIIEICRGITNNRYYDDLWDDMEDGIRQGQRLSESISGSKLIPPSVASMITSGEKSGRLADVTERIAAFAEEELDTRVKQVTSYIEPIMIMLMGLIIGGIAMALLLPVFSMGRVMSGG